MYNSFALGKKYISYRLKASNGKGHGVHSPFVFNFIKDVLRNNNQLLFAASIEARRAALLRDRSFIDVIDFGAGSTSIKSNKRQVSAIAKSSLKPRKYAELIGKIVQYFKIQSSLELGTSLGTTTSYIALSNPKGKVFSFEGDSNIAAIAQRQFEILGISNIQSVVGSFEETLPTFIKDAQRIDLFFLDGNHRKQPTLDYFEMLLPLASEYSIFIFDDIHWSEEMESAWEEIKKDDRVTLTIDLFFIGLVFLRKEFLIKQDFVIKY